VRPLMLRSGQGGGHVRDRFVFERTGRPCQRCGTSIRARGQGDDNRTTYWCPTCQA
jgi:endonuclease VIII